MNTNTQNQNTGLRNRSEHHSTRSGSQDLGNHLVAGLGSQLSTRKTGLARINHTRRRMNRSLDTLRLLNLLRSRAPEFFGMAEVVGKWVWIQFADKQPPTVTSQLSELGFHWNNTRQAWQHPCGLNRHEATPYDPRKYFGSYFAADMMHG